MTRCGLIIPVLVAFGIAPCRAGADEVSELRNHGIQLLAEMKLLEDGATDTLYFEYSMSSKPVGVGELTLTAQKIDGRLIYQYRHEARIRGPSQRRSHNLIEARLTPYFQPLSIEMAETYVSPKTGTTRKKISVTVAETEVVSTILKNGRTTQRRMSVPEDPFVFGAELLLEHLSLARRNRFSLLDFDPERCATTEVTFAVSKKDDGRLYVKATYGIPDQYNYFWLDPGHRLDGWGEFPPKLVVERVSRASYETLIEVVELDFEAPSAESSAE